MAEYIERDIAAAFANNCGAVYVANRLSDSNAFPAADVAPVVHGRWINPPLWGIGVCACSHCKYKSQIFVFSNVEIIEKFCPLCGARMDGDGNG